jgi:hypothetical protein
MAQALLDELAELWDAGAAVIEVITVEEPRALDLAQRLASRVGARFAYWSMHRGLEGIDPAARDAIAALDAIARHNGPVIAVMLDLHEALKTHAVARRLRDLVGWFAANDRCLLLVSAQAGLPRGLSEESARVDIGPPDERELGAHFDQIAADTVPERKPSTDGRHRLVRAALGLTTSHARRAFARALSRDPTAGEAALTVVGHEKRRLFSQDLGLDFIESPESLDALGGLESFKQWLIERQSALGPQATSFGLSAPRGVLLLGVQGCGKSLAAKCAASFLGLPLVRLDLLDEALALVVEPSARSGGTSRSTPRRRGAGVLAARGFAEADLEHGAPRALARASSPRRCAPGAPCPPRQRSTTRAFRATRACRPTASRPCSAPPSAAPRPIGALYLQGRAAPGPFPERERQLAEAFAKRVAPLALRLHKAAPGDAVDHTRELRARLTLDGSWAAPGPRRQCLRTLAWRARWTSRCSSWARAARARPSSPGPAR